MNSYYAAHTRHFIEELQKLGYNIEETDDKPACERGLFLYLARKVIELEATIDKLKIDNDLYTL